MTFYGRSNIFFGNNLKLGDVNGDSRIDGQDYAIIMKNFGQSTSGGTASGDINGDGMVDRLDMRIVINNFNL